MDKVGAFNYENYQKFKGDEEEDTGEIKYSSSAFKKFKDESEEAEAAPATDRPSKVFFATQGVGRGALETLIIPFEAVNFALEKTGINTFIRKMSKKVGVDIGTFEETKALARAPYKQVKPETFSERMFQRTGEEVGAGFIPTAGAIGMSGKVYKESKGILGAFIKVLLDLRGQSPQKLLAIESGIAASGGAGAGIAKEAFPDSSLAEIAGVLVGSFTPTIALNILKWVRYLPGKFLPPVSDDAITESVSKSISGLSDTSTGGKFDTGIEEARVLKQEIEGFEPTTAQATGEAGLIAQEQSLTRSEPISTHKFLDQQARSQQAIRSKLDELVDEGELSELEVQDILKTRKESLDASLKRRTEKAETKLTEAGGEVREVKADIETAKSNLDTRLEKLDASLETRITRAKEKVDSEITNLKGKQKIGDEGDVLETALEKEIAEFKIESDKNFGALDKANEIELPFDNVVDTAKDIKGIKSKFEDAGDTPDVVHEILKKGKSADIETFNDIRGLRTRILNDIRNETLSANPKRNKIRKLNQLLDSVQESLDELGESTQFPEIAKLYNKANEAFKKGVVRLRQGITGKVTKKVEGGGFVTPPSQIASKFFTKGVKSKEAIDAFKSSIGKSPEARTALESFMSKKLIDNVVDPVTGKVSRRKLATFLRDHKEALNEFPELRNSINSTAKAQKQLELFETKAKDIAKKVRKGEIGIREAEALGLSKKDLFDAEKTFDMAESRYKEVTTGSISKGISKTLNDADKSVAGKLLNADAGKAMRDVLNSKTPSRDMAKLIKLVRKDPRGKRGLKILFHEEMLRKGATKNIAPDGIPFLSHNYIKDFLTNFEGVVKQLYTKQEIASLKKIQRALELNNRSLKSPLPSGSDTFQNIKLAQNVNAITARLFALQRKVVSKSFLVAERIARWFASGRELASKEKLRALMEDALFNPDIAETLIMMSKNVDEKIITKRLRGHLASIGAEDEQKKER